MKKLISSFYASLISATFILNIVSCKTVADVKEIIKEEIVYEDYKINDQILKPENRSKIKIGLNDFYTGYRTKGDIAKQEVDARPLVSYFMPDELRDWTLEKDRDSKYNAGNVKLRSKKPTALKTRKNQNPKVKFMNIPTANVHTSGWPTQGQHGQMDNYIFNHWQYNDIFVPWAGAYNEGIIITPGAELIDQAHIHGNEIFGVMFFAHWYAPNNSSASLVNNYFFKEKDDKGIYKSVYKMLDLARGLNFDGWFVNDEDPNITEELANWVLQFKEVQQAQGLKANDEQYIKLIHYKNTSYIDDHSFGKSALSNYDYKMLLQNSPVNQPLEYAKQNNRDPYDIFASRDWTSKQQYLFSNQFENIGGLINENGQANASLAYFGTADSWKDWARVEVSQDIKGFERQKAINDLFNKYEDSFWIGGKKISNSKYDYDLGALNLADPEYENKYVYGVSQLVQEKTTLLDSSFATNFNNGQGFYQFLNGEKVAFYPYNHRGIQDTVPTYRWYIKNLGANNNNVLKANYDFDNAWEGMSSLQMSGTVSAYQESYWKLYGSWIPAENQKISLIYRPNKNTTKLKFHLEYTNESEDSIWAQNEIAFNNNDKVFSDVVEPDIEELANGWKKATINQVNKGKRITSLGLNVYSETDGDITLNLGRLEIDDKQELNNEFISNMVVEWLGETPSDESKVNMRFYWEDNSAQVDKYEIYQLHNNNFYFKGATRSKAYYVENATKYESDKITLCVRGVNKFNVNKSKLTCNVISLEE